MSYITDGPLDPPDCYEPAERDGYETGWTDDDYAADAADRENDLHGRKSW